MSRHMGNVNLGFWERVWVWAKFALQVVNRHRSWCGTLHVTAHSIASQLGHRFSVAGGSRQNIIVLLHCHTVSMGKNMSLLSNNFDLFCKLRLTFQQAAAEEQVCWIWCNYYIYILYNYSKRDRGNLFSWCSFALPTPVLLQSICHVAGIFQIFQSQHICSLIFWLFLLTYLTLKLTWAIAGGSRNLLNSVSWAGCRGQLHAASRWWPGCQRCGPGWGALDGINAILMWQNVTKGHAMSCSCDACGSRNQKESILAI